MVGTTAAIHFHAATLILWIALAVTQVVLVRRGRADLHRQLGKLAYVLIPLLCLGFVLAVDDGLRRHGAADGPPLIAVFFDGGLFLAYVGLGLLHRHRPEYHRRLMVLALIPLINPPLGRVVKMMGIFPPVVLFPVQLVIIITLFVRARRRQELARPYAIGLALYPAFFVGMMVAMGLWQMMFGR